VPGEKLPGSARLAGAPPSRRSRLKRLLIIPGAAVALWMAAVMLITDRSVAVCDPRRFKNVLAVFPHADDETLDCAGSLARFPALPTRLLSLLVLVGQVADASRTAQRRATPTHRLFVGSAIVPKIRAWSAYRSQRGSIGKGLGRIIPAWLPVSLLRFEYFADASPPPYPPPEGEGK